MNYLLTVCYNGALVCWDCLLVCVYWWVWVDSWFWIDLFTCGCLCLGVRLTIAVCAGVLGVWFCWMLVCLRLLGFPLGLGLDMVMCFWLLVYYC